MAPRKPRHDHVLRAKGGSPVIVAATLPEGKFIDWYQPPEPSAQFAGLGEVEYLVDGKVVARGGWPDVLEQARRK